MSNDADKIFTAQLAAEMVARTDKLGKENVDLAIQVKQAREFLDWSAHHMRTLWLDWVDESNKISQEMNLFRMSFDRESKAMVSTGKDVKDFFNSGEYITAHQRLADLMTLLERFREFKADGTLDAFADFILKVSCNSPSKS